MAQVEKIDVANTAKLIGGLYFSIQVFLGDSMGKKIKCRTEGLYRPISTSIGLEKGENRKTDLHWR